MKTKILFLLFAYCSLTSASQGLEFNRSIDTTFTITIPIGVIGDGSDSFNFINSETLTPPQGKVWKVQTVAMSTSNNPDNYTLQYCDNFNGWSSLSSGYVKFDLFKNNMPLCSRSLYDIFLEPYFLNDTPFWINSNSTLQLKGFFKYDNEVCLSSDYSGLKVWFSILEFNEN